jgi:hypothetical protein
MRRHGGSRKRTSAPVNHQLPANLRIKPMPTGNEIQKRNAFAACTVSRILGLGTSLDCARDIAVRDELDAVRRHIEEAQRYLSQIRVLHQEALDEFSGAQGE